MKNGESILADRLAENLAIMVLTRVPGLQLSRPDRSTGLDFIATLSNHSNGNGDSTVFGVLIKSTMNIEKIVGPDGVVEGNTAASIAKVAQNSTVPAALLVIDLATEEARFGWVPHPAHDFGKHGTSTGQLQTVIATKMELESAITKFRLAQKIGSASTTK
ncbi:hypothetical protein SAMN02982985_00036 [Rugamonas rubra]|uniref:DUF4365 domain-containing protein n=2 Tax=Rugamonas rubra TaxID=758825 RepID=A0A1I4HIF4_9BURK|nr:hypothetical protein SAMN02982985_00036 [Rugamonas rubra]